jgi:hypothetical protein
MSNRRFVTLFLMALALTIQVLGAVLLETSKPHHSQVLPTSSNWQVVEPANSVTARALRGEFSPSPVSVYANDPND